jgi:glycosyltransferase involved in cell wall biosynthesis
MRIAYIHQYYTTREMPGGTRSYELARRLVERGHEVHVITTDTGARHSGVRWRESVHDGVHVHRMPVPYSNAMSYRRRIASFVQFAVGASTRATRVHPDVVLATSTPLTVAIPGIVAAKLRRVAFVFEVRDLWPELPIEIGALHHPVTRWAALRLAETAYRNADRVIALSPGMADGVAAHGYPRQRITVVPNACDVDLFGASAAAAQAFRADRPWLGARPLVVYAGTFGVVNGVDYLVRVAAHMRDREPDVRFLLLGEGKTRQQVTALAERLGVLGRTLFIEPGIPKDQVPAVLEAATITTSVVVPLPGLWVNSANKFFDGLAAGRPVAINHGGWQADLLSNSGAGVVLDGEDPGAAAEVLAARLGDSAWLESAGRAARALATGLFSRDILFERFEAALLGLPVADLDLLSPLTLQEGVAEPGPTAQALPAAGKE